MSVSFKQRLETPMRAAHQVIFDGFGERLSGFPHVLAANVRLVTKIGPFLARSG
jgi:hypothetical protein